MFQAVPQKERHARPHEGEHDAVDFCKIFAVKEDADQKLDRRINIH